MYVLILSGARKRNINNNRQFNDNSRTKKTKTENTTENDFVKQNR